MPRMPPTPPPSPLTRVAERLAERHGRVGTAALAVEEALSALLARARAAWPALDVGDEAFLDHLSATLSAEDDLLSALSALHAADLYLAAACAMQHPAALAEFERLHIAAVPRALSRLGPTQDFIEEVQQMLRERLLVSRGGAARIADYSGRGALGAWVRIAAVRTALGLRRTRKEALGRRGTLPDQAAEVTDPDIEALRRRYRHLLKSAVQTALASLPDEDRLLLRLHVIEGVTVAELGARHGVHGATISRRITRIRGVVLSEARRLVSEQGRLRESELESVVRVLRADLDVSIERILAPGA
jgi:RNA polymerase sigma-70 factor (ECF subfamily)